MTIYNCQSEAISGPWLLHTVCCDKRSQYVRDHRVWGGCNDAGTAHWKVDKMHLTNDR